MANAQKQFDDFDAVIRRFDDDTKREKRDMLLDQVCSGLKDKRPAFSRFNQGSYAMHTRVAPVSGDDDLDAGIVFTDSAASLGCPVELKKDIFDVLNNVANRTVEIKRPCVRVQYLKNGEPDYHIDIAVYAQRDDDHLDLALGKNGSPGEFRVWDEQDPKGVISKIRDKYAGSDDWSTAHRFQFRRCIRMLKRWRDHQYGQNVGPISIALTVAGYNWFSPVVNVVDNTPDDLTAMRDWVQRILDEFLLISDCKDDHDRRIVIRHIGFPNNDLMEGRDSSQHRALHKKLGGLLEALNDAIADKDPHSACETLQCEFGSDFPVPPKSSTGKSTTSAVVTTGTSA